MTKDIIVYLDSDGDIVDYVSANNTSDAVFAICNELSKNYNEQLVPFYATVQIGERYSDRIHKDVVSATKDPLDTCHKHGLCSDVKFKETFIDRATRCPICPRKEITSR